MTFADKILKFYKALKIKESLPNRVEVLNPYQDKTAFELCTQFYKKYYDDNGRRSIIFGINPGRFGGGLTGVPFTDPVKLEKICGISNGLQKKTELSADFIHAMIAAFGGVESFFSKFYFNSVSPLGFTYEGKNLNYYDTKDLAQSLEKFIRKSILQQMEFGVNEVVYCLGEGENFKYLQNFNKKEKIFAEIIPLAHPRFIMQYKRKYVEQYIADYLKKFALAK
ncbi:uracil-DNA glycosylase family protein [Chryseosolibacter indicus]|uniref:DUF4918 family protein n=1 Tax=Chryseosolibacter indicus TaxID=2782351 RepID=A0ABS5VR44_9BACT|nr:uracil-DNA glycosylase family protein [Chryseosolibacter indicus]MBT1703893.1 DUF4918 family protein [Chryseosolibacter indicus]